MAHVPDQVPHLHRLLGHEQDDGLWLSKDLGFSDQAAGALVGWVWAPAMTVFTLLAGSLTDAIGLRRTFFLGVAICTFARSVMVVTTIPSLALACGVLPLAVGEALGTPVLLAATRRYSTTRTALDLVLDHLHGDERRLHRRRMDFRLRPATESARRAFFGFQPTTHQQLFLVSLAIRDRAFPGDLFSAARRGSENAAEARTPVGTSRLLERIGRRCGRARSRRSGSFGRLLGQSAFYRLLVFFLLIGFLKAIFLQMDYVFPKFGDRELGLHAPVGKLASINAIVIIFLVPVVGALTQRFAAYRMVVIGGAICAAGVFIMALPTDWF